MIFFGVTLSLCYLEKVIYVVICVAQSVVEIENVNGLITSAGEERELLLFFYTNRLHVFCGICKERFHLPLGALDRLQCLIVVHSLCLPYFYNADSKNIITIVNIEA